MSDETTLLPCPFCGGEASIEKYCDMCSTEIDFKCARDKSPDAICAIGEEVFWVEHKCELLSNDEELYVGCFTSAREAIAAWNTRATHGTLTAEQVREAVEASTFAETSTIREFNDSSWQAIADELNAELGSGTCEVECFDDGVDEGLDGEWFSYAPPTWYLSCGHTAQGTERPNFCPVCGKVVKR